jgi:MSHA biogenesis protein MshQ
VAAPGLTYLGEDIAPSTSQNIGRFIPDRFTVTDNTPAFADECLAGSFTYLEQPFFYSLATAPALTVTALNTAPALTVTALNTAGDVTENYDGENFWKLSSTLSDRDYTDNAAASSTFSVVKNGGITLSGETDFTGAATLTLDNGSTGDEFMYDRGTEEAPFAADVDLVFSVADLTDDDLVCLDVDNDNTCESYTIAALTGANLRFGRLTIGTAFGSELLPLEVPMQTEFFSGSGFVLNTDDSCTSLLNTDLILSSAVEALQTDGDVSVGGGSTTANIANAPLVLGKAGLSFSAPGTGNTGDVDITIDLGTVAPGLDMPWLQYDWDGNGTHDNNPQGRAAFGLYSGNSEYIYIREPWN